MPLVVPFGSLGAVTRAPIGVLRTQPETRELMSATQFADAMASFKGIRRRLDRKSEKTSVALFEGFGFSRWGHLPAIAELDGVARDLVIVGRRV